MSTPNVRPTLAQAPVQAHCGLQILRRFLRERIEMTGAISALSIRRRSLLAALCLGAASALTSRAGLRSGSGWHRRRRREGDRFRGQYLDDPDGRSQGWRRGPSRDPAITAGLAVRGILRRFLQEPPRRQGGRRLQPHKANSLGSGFIVDPSASLSPTTTSSPMPTRSTSS